MKKSILTLLLAALSTGANANDKAGDSPASLAVSAFLCSTYAEMIGESNEQMRLFELGVKSARAYIEGVKSKTISENTVKDIPLLFSVRLGGPSTDFMVGRVFEGTANHAYDKVVKEDVSGFPITDPAKWAKGELKTLRAQNLFRSGNCKLIR
jgi:hypothetical protein